MDGIVQTKRIQKWKLRMVFLKWISHKSTPCKHMLLGDWIIYFNFELQHCNHLWFHFHISSVPAILPSAQLVPSHNRWYNNSEIAVQIKQMIAITLYTTGWMINDEIYNTFHFYTCRIFKSPCTDEIRLNILLQPV